jgi:hypothetical protein
MDIWHFTREHCQVCNTSSICVPSVWEPILVTANLQHIMYDVCSCSSLLVTISPHQAIHICLKSLQTVQHCNTFHTSINIQATDHFQLATDRCCYCVSCTQDPDHCTNLFTSSHSDLKVLFSAHTVPSSLPIMQPLHCTQYGQDIQM